MGKKKVKEEGDGEEEIKVKEDKVDPVTPSKPHKKKVKTEPMEVEGED